MFFRGYGMRVFVPAQQRLPAAEDGKPPHTSFHESVDVRYKTLRLLFHAGEISLATSSGDAPC